jgi:hypothetical protein
MKEMLQAYEGYLEEGKIFPIGMLENLKGRRRVIITVLDEPENKKSNTWDELDKIVSEMTDKPKVEDFPRCELGRGSVNLNGV